MKEAFHQPAMSDDLHGGLSLAQYTVNLLLSNPEPVVIDSTVRPLVLPVISVWLINEQVNNFVTLTTCFRHMQLVKAPAVRKTAFHQPNAFNKKQALWLY